MKKMQTLLTTLLLVSALITKGQSVTSSKDGLVSYPNNFMDYKDKNVDSALYFIKLMAANPAYENSVQNLLHNQFAQVFQKMWERDMKDSLGKIELKKKVEIGYKILERMMADNNRNLVNNVTPIYYWTKVQQYENDTGKLIEWTNKFIATELSTNDIYQNRIGRYALLIYQVISQKKELKSLAEQLFKTTINKLKLNQVNVNVDSASRLVLEKRTWYRYLYAYSNYIQANKALEIGNNKEAGEGFKTAFDYSPDLTDKNNSSAYFYDMFFLLEKDKRTFQDDYLDYLAKHSEDKKRTLSTLLTMALTNPTYKEQLKTFYNINFPNEEGFNDYWMKNSSKNLKNAPDISIKKTDGLLFSSAANKGKWILIDFWGTWCSPCRKEHPDLEKFYQTIKSSLSNKITLLTVACKDKEDKVSSYMSQFNYSFPVAMADNEIENVYNVKSYPSKILISPQGKYLIVPFGVDWVDFVKKYADL